MSFLCSKANYNASEGQEHANTLKVRLGVSCCNLKANECETLRIQLDRVGSSESG